MQSELKSLSKIFSESIFRIPDYQRGYSWQVKQLKDFWNDIEQLPKGKSHYTGVLTLEPVNKSDYCKWEDDLWIIESKKYVPLYVVDGQQRLTTAIILLQAVLEKLPEGKELNFTERDDIRKKYIFESKDKGISRSYIFGYERDNPSYEFLKTGIFLEPSDNHHLSEETIYTKNLAAAKKFFSDKLEKLSINEVEEVYTKLTQHIQFNIFYIEPELDVFVTFETMNNRGKALSHLELLKNRLIYLSTKFHNEKSETARLRRTVNESWKTIYHYLGKINSLRVDDDTFLQTHFTCYFGPALLKEGDEGDDKGLHFRRLARQDGYKDYLLEDRFSPKRISGSKSALTLEEVNAYAKDIKETVKLYYEVLDPEASSFSDEEKKVLSQLARLANNNGLLLAIAAVKHLPANEKRLTLLTCIERRYFLTRFRPYAFSNIGGEEMAIRLVDGELSAEEVTRTFEENNTRFVETADFVDAIRGIGKAQGYYGWGATRYLMYEYEQHLRAKSKTARQVLNWDDYNVEDFEFDHKTIEHIYPQRANDEYWKTRFAAYSIPERNLLRNSLGNLLPVSHPKNASLSNASFLLKKGSSENQVGYRYGCLSEVQVAQEDDWTAVHILRRGILLLEFMEERWAIKIGEVAKKIEVLNLGFVLAREGLTVETLTSSTRSSVLRRRRIPKGSN